MVGSGCESTDGRGELDSLLGREVGIMLCPPALSQTHTHDGFAPDDFSGHGGPWWDCYLEFDDFTTAK